MTNEPISVTVHLGKAGWVRLVVDADLERADQRTREYVGGLLKVMADRLAEQAEEIKASS